MKKLNTRIVALFVLPLSLLTLPVACAKHADDDHMQHDHADHAAMSDHHHHDHAATQEASKVTAQSYSDAIKQIQARMTSLDTLIKAKKYDDVHEDSEAIRALCNSLGQLAAASNSGVPAGRVQEVTNSAKQLSAATHSFHNASHDEDLPHLQEHYQHMSKLVDALARAGTP